LHFILNPDSKPTIFKMIKEAKTIYPVIDLIRKRWSARSFSEKQISEYDLKTLFEAASWAPSANNEQPWQYFYSSRASEGFQKLWECLLPGNQPWTKNASVLIASVARKTNAGNQKENPCALHDVGMANAQLFLQATSMNIYGHPMAGIDKNKLSSLLKLNDQQEPICMIALGYLDEAGKLEEPFKTRELSPRQRKPVEEIITSL
jgi:nitroreductase